MKSRKEWLVGSIIIAIIFSLLRIFGIFETREWCAQYGILADIVSYIGIFLIPQILVTNN